MGLLSRHCYSKAFQSVCSSFCLMNHSKYDESYISLDIAYYTMPVTHCFSLESSS